MKTNYIYTTIDEIPLSFDFYKNKVNESKPTITYFHGGGLIFGSKDDLPKTYIDSFLNEGYNLITLDYPLAPECKIDTIFSAIQSFFDWFEINYQKTLHLKTDDKILFGRSAGAYLALQWASKIKVSGVISFYGYHTLFHNDFLLPSESFKKYPILPFADVTHLLSNHFLTSSSVEERYPIYLSLRQSGNWIKEILGKDNLIDDYSLTVNQLKKLPPIFITASRSDEDVPFFLSNMLSKQVTNSTFIKHTGVVHDFDRQPELAESKLTYDALLTWLNELTE